MVKGKRYVVKIEMFVHAENDYMARKTSHKIADKIKDGYEVDVVEIGELPFASINYRQLEDISKPQKKKEDDRLPF
jgi:hypothetical protein